ncbi:MAG: imidazolonepropionase [Phycisphaeraceae bacterium]|nr:imidazolonepropionase [Phycisphaeraceae bacterium]
MTNPVRESAAKERTLIKGARVLTLRGSRRRRGTAFGDLGVLPCADVLIEGETIAAVGPHITADQGPSTTVIEARGRVLMPGFVDCHTHACWAGDRLDEWERRLAGADYLEILAAGGGIMSTVRAVRAGSREGLASLLARRLSMFLQSGTTTVEVKSGYGLNTQAELMMLGAIDDAASAWRGTLVPTALLGHAIDTDQPEFIDRTITETLDAVHEAYPGVTIDAYCERGAWSVRDTIALFRRAASMGHPVRVHADQFTSLGMTPAAVELGARSVDHLEASTPEDLGVLAGSETFGVGLPVCGLHLADHRYAPLRTLAGMGGLVAIATNLNPGSAPCGSMPLAVAVAVRCCGLTPAQAIIAATLHGAEVLGMSDRGMIVAGQRADVVLLSQTDERALAFELGSDPVDVVIAGGAVMKHRA